MTDPATEADPLRRLAAEQVTDVVALYRLDGVCVYAGEACQSVLGYDREAWRALPACDVVHPADRRALVSRFARGAEPALPWKATLRVRRESGDYLWLETTARLVRGPEGAPLVRASARDVTQRKRAEDAVHYLGRQVKQILDAAADGIFGVDLRGAITFVNPAAADALGYRVEELSGRPYALILPPDAPRPDPIDQAIRAGEATRVAAAEFLRSDGGRLPVEYTASPARREGEVVGGVVTFRDVGDRLRAEAALRRADWLAGVGQTALAVRHEINNPLTSLLAESSLLETGGNSPAEEREMIASIGQHARRIRDVVRRLTERQADPPVRTDGPQPMLDLSGEE